MPGNVAQPLWLLLPAAAAVVFLLAPRNNSLPGDWPAILSAAMRRHLGAQNRNLFARKHRLLLLGLWALFGLTLAGISLGSRDAPDPANLKARVLLLDMANGGVERDCLLAARALIAGTQLVPTGVIGSGAEAYDVVPVTTDRRQLDRYLQVLDNKLLPPAEHNPALALQRAAALLARGNYLTGQVILLTTGELPAALTNSPLADNTRLWIMVDEPTRWRNFGSQAGATVASLTSIDEVAADLDIRSRRAALQVTSVRERREITPWLIAVGIICWLLLFMYRRKA